MIAVLALTAWGCVYDPDARCGPGQSHDESQGLCVCDAGSVIAADGDGCEVCGEHEEVAGGACVCEDGYARAGETSPCEMIAAGLGDRCDPAAETPCADEDFSYCFSRAGAEPYCTRPDCDDDGDCPAEHACADDGGNAFCKAPPTGRGKSCSVEADCVDFEANYCEALFINMCLVEGCAEGGDGCHGDWACCDFRDLAGVSLCVPPDQLDGETCPLGVPRGESE